MKTGSLLTVGLPMAAALWLWPRRRRLDAWVAMAALGAGYTLVLGPWLGRNAVLAGRLIGKASEPSHIPAWLNVVAFSRTLLLDLLPAVALVSRLPLAGPDWQPAARP